MALDRMRSSLYDYDCCRIQAADYRGEPRGRVANCQRGAHLVLKVAQIDIVAVVDGAPLRVWLALMSKHIACQCSALGWWPTRWGLHPPVAASVWPIGRYELLIDSGRSASKGEHSPIAATCRSVFPHNLTITHLGICTRAGTVIPMSKKMVFLWAPDGVPGGASSPAPSSRCGLGSSGLCCRGSSTRASSPSATFLAAKLSCRS